MSAADNKTMLRHVMQTLMRGAWIMVVSLIFFVGLAAAYLYWADPVYEAETSVIVETKDRTGTMDFAGLSAFRDVLVEVEILESLDLAKRVADRMLEERAGTAPGRPAPDWPVFVEATDPELTTVSLARVIQDNIDIEQVRREVGVIRIKNRSSLPEEAKYVANLYATEYAQRNLELSRSEASGLKEFLESQIGTRQEELVSAENALKDYQEAEGAIALDQEVEALTNRMADLQSRRDQALVERQVIESELTSLKEQVDRIQPNLYDRVSSGVENEIAELQTQIARREAQVETKYARNPLLRGNEQQDPDLAREIREIEALRNEVSTRARRLVDEVLATGGIDPDMARRLGDGAGLTGALANVSRLRQQITDKTIESSGLDARLRVLNSRLAQDQREFNRIPEQSVRLAGLERSRASSEMTFEWLQQRYQEARIAEASEFGSVRVLDTAELPDEPVEPRSIYLLALSIILGTVVGLIGVFSREMVDETLRQPDELRRLGIPVAGVIPDLRRASSRRRNGVAPEMVTITDPTSAAADAFSRVAMTVEIGGVGSAPQSVLVTSVQEGDGKSMVAANLAVTTAAAGHRTLLIDLNTWNPSTHRMLGTLPVPGVSNVLYEGKLVRECVHQTVVEGLYVMPLGDIDVSAGHFLASPDLVAMMGYLRRSFGRIVIDAGSLLSSGRTMALSSLADAVLVVLRSGETRQADLKEAMDLLENANITQRYAVLNAFNARAAYGYFADRSYYGRFGSGREKRGLAQGNGRGMVRTRPAPERAAYAPPSASYQGQTAPPPPPPFGHAAYGPGETYAQQAPVTATYAGQVPAQASIYPAS